MTAKLMQAFAKKLEERKACARYRSLKINKAGCDFFSNDYLGFSRKEALRRFYLEKLLAAPEASYGATGSRLLSGNAEHQVHLEEKLASHFAAPAALLFNSGYTANLGLLQALSEENDILLLDEAVHASFKNGAKLAKGQTYFFAHNDLDHLEGKLKRLSHKGQCYVVVESVYSMDGSLCPLKELLSLTQKYEAALILDEAHGLGTLGACGEGLSQSLALEDEIFARVYTFGKALSCHGACVVGSQLLKEMLINYSQTFIYTTALSFDETCKIASAFHFLEESAEDFARLQANIALRNKLFESPLQSSPIQLLKLADPCLDKLSESLREQGIAAYPIRSPTVKKKDEGLRIVLHSFNSAEELQTLKEVIYKHVT